MTTLESPLESPLDRAVLAARNALYEAGVPEPDVVLFLGTGFGALSAHLRSVGRKPLGRAAEVPASWRGRELVHGRIGKGVVWLIEDAPEDMDEEGAAWERAFPLWLAAASGAQLALVTAAGVALAVDDPVPAGTLVVLRDHINLSGGTPLLGLGHTHLGPLFPDQTSLHHTVLRDRALEVARKEGITLCEGIAACTLGPGLDTPAELAWLAQTGASVAVQGLADTQIAAAHAGLGLVTLVAATDDGSRPVRMSDLVQRSERLAPALEDLIVQLLPGIIEEAQAWAEEELDEDIVEFDPEDEDDA